ILGSGHDAMVTKEFWPRSAPTAITNVSLPWPNPILINAGRDALTPATSALDDALITRHANAFKPSGKTLTWRAVDRCGGVGAGRYALRLRKPSIRPVAGAPPRP